eukprot:1723393-Rhodomonas_salina.1
MVHTATRRSGRVASMSTPNTTRGRIPDLMLCVRYSSPILTEGVRLLKYFRWNENDTIFVGVPKTVATYCMPLGHVTL